MSLRLSGITTAFTVTIMYFCVLSIEHSVRSFPVDVGYVSIIQDELLKQSAVLRGLVKMQPKIIFIL